MKIFQVYFLIPLGFMLFTTSCYYDSKEYLYPNTSCNDTIAPVTFSGKISPILNQYCISCHSSSNPQGNVILSTYEGVKTMVTANNQLLHSILQDGSVPSMPQNGGKLDDCKIQAITIWINAGANKN